MHKYNNAQSLTAPPDSPLLKFSTCIVFHLLLLDRSTALLIKQH